MGILGPNTTVLALFIVAAMYATAYGLTLHDNVLLWGAAAFLQIPVLIINALASTQFAIILVPLALFALIAYFNKLGDWAGDEFLDYVILGYVIVVVSGVF